MTEAEAGELTKAAGAPPSFDSTERLCSYLDGNRRCKVYADRPAICRLYGAVDSAHLRCPHGCEPTMTDAAGKVLLQRVADLFGESGDAPVYNCTLEQMKALVESVTGEKYEPEDYNPMRGIL